MKTLQVVLFSDQHLIDRLTRFIFAVVIFMKFLYSFTIRVQFRVFELKEFSGQIKFTRTNILRSMYEF